MKTLTIQLKPETLAEVDQIAQRDGRPRSQFVRRIVERAVEEVTGRTRLADLEQIATVEISTQKERRP